MRILGIDPGYATIGFGLITAERAQVNMLTYGAITTPAATLAAAMVAYDAGDWRVAFNVVNLTDKVHITQCLARGDCFYGQARTYTLTSTYRF